MCVWVKGYFLKQAFGEAHPTSSVNAASVDFRGANIQDTPTYNINTIADCATTGSPWTTATTLGQKSGVCEFQKFKSSKLEPFSTRVKVRVKLRSFEIDDVHTTR